MRKPSNKKSIYGENEIDKNYSSIGFRLDRLICKMLGATNKKIYAELEARTKVDSDTWRQWHRKYDKSEPSSRLIQAAALEWPQYSFWLVTGFDDPIIGQLKAGKGTQHSLVAATINNEKTGKKVEEIAEVTSYYFKIHTNMIRRVYGEETLEELKTRSLLNLDGIDQQKMDVLYLARLKKIKEVIDEQIKTLEAQS